MATSQETKRSWVTLLYFYLAAIIGLSIMITGTLIAAHALLDVIFYEGPNTNVGMDGSEFQMLGGVPDRGDEFQTVLRGLVTAAVGFPVFWWHLRQAQRADPSPHTN